jgi:hypothetical protein
LAAALRLKLTIKIMVMKSSNKNRLVKKVIFIYKRLAATKVVTTDPTTSLTNTVTTTDPTNTGLRI